MKSKVLLSVFIILTLVLSSFALLPLTKETKAAPGDFEHFVIGEEFTATWCQYCPAAAEQLNDIYHNDGYEFYFVALICDVNDKAADRMDDYPTATGYPTVEFDGGYREESGAQGDKSAYQGAIEESGARSDTPISLELSMSYEGDSAINVKTNVRWDEDGTMVNPSQEVYLRVYITEIESRYINNDGEPYHFGFLDYAFDEGLSLNPHEWWEGETTWVGSEHEDSNGDDFGDIDYENIAIIASVFNDEAGEDDYNLMTAGTIAPELEISAPADGSSQDGDFTLAATSQDSMESGDPTVISSVEYQLDDESWKNMPKKSGNDYEVEVDTSDLDDGEHSLNVRTSDDKGTSCEKEISFTLSSEDTKAPEIRNAAPGQGDKVSGTVDISAEVTDDSDFTVDYKMNEEAWQSMTRGSGDSYSARWDSTEVLDGDHKISIRAEDDYGNDAEKSMDITVENLELVISSPGEEDTVSNMVEVVGDLIHAAEIDTARYRIDSGSWKDMEMDGDRCSADWNSRDVSNGDHAIDIKVTDTIGNSEEKSVDVTVENTEEDTTPPELTIQEPGDGDTLSDTSEIRVEATDEGGIYKVEFRTSGQTWQELSETSGDIYRYDWNTRELENGDYTLEFRAQDSSGNEVSDNIDITIYNEVDETTPLLEAIYPLEGTPISLTGEELQVLVHASDDSELSEVSSSLDGGSYREMTLDQELSDTYEKDIYRFDYTSEHQELRDLMEGSASLDIRATDGSNNQAELTVSFDVDSTPPLAELTLPYYVAKTFELGFVFSDANGIDSFSAGVDDVTLVGEEDPKSEGSLSIDLSGFEEGGHRFWLDVSDLAGNTGEYGADIEIDTTVPGFELLSPSGNFLRIAGEVELQAQVVDENPGTLTWAVGELGLEFVQGDEDYLSTFDSTLLEDGRHDIVFEARDLAGNSYLFETDILVDNTAPVLLDFEVGPEQVEIDEDIYFEVEVEDTGTGVESVTLWYEICQDDTCLLAEVEEMTFKRGVYETDISFETWGTVTYHFIFKDELGNKFITENKYVEVVGDDAPQEGAAPPASVLLTSLFDDQEVSGDLHLEGGAYDAEDVRFKIDDRDWITVNTRTNIFSQSMADFTLTDLDGNEITLESLEGKVVILDFMATWCSGCKTLSDNLKPISQEFKDSVVIISVDVDSKESQEDLAAYKASHGTNWAYAFDTADLANTYQIDALPHLIFVTPDGKISGRFTGAKETEFLEAQLGLALSEKAWSYTIDTTSLANGQHDITIETGDGSKSETRSFMVHNAGSGSEADDDELDTFYLAAGALLLLAAFGIGAAVLLRGQDTEEEDEGSYACPDCGGELDFITDSDSWYCYDCRDYF